MTTSGHAASSPNLVVLWYTRVMEAIGGGAMVVIVAVMIVQVVMRYVFNASLIWAEELCRYLLVMITFLLIGLAFQRGELVAVDLVANALSPRLRFILKLAVSIPLLAFLYQVTSSGYTFASRMGLQTIPALDFIWASIAGRDRTLDVSIFWVYGTVAAGSALLMIHLVVALILEGKAVFGRAGPE